MELKIIVKDRKQNLVEKAVFTDPFNTRGDLRAAPSKFIKAHIAKGHLIGMLESNHVEDCIASGDTIRVKDCIAAGDTIRVLPTYNEYAMAIFDNERLIGAEVGFEPLIEVGEHYKVSRVDKDGDIWLYNYFGDKTLLVVPAIFVEKVR